MRKKELRPIAIASLKGNFLDTNLPYIWGKHCDSKSKKERACFAFTSCNAQLQLPIILFLPGCRLASLCCGRQTLLAASPPAASEWSKPPARLCGWLRPVR